ncbi:4-alpha-glucanotransferase [Puia dinghuensis]|uniref:4-alpha-glucanotransferase n=1 Tax=Puia dinghuensis TaxID=1792502 RepID=A0A8J2U7C3_9BACT|nr:4-alpha-glucanotransferase [Puia dinghuensis]GGA83879.1 4-alpha-glucanotransferase [Puia dinghuensis]
MKLDFYLRFHTNPGQSILLVGNIAELGNGQLAAAMPLDYVNGEFWHGSVLLTEAPADTIYYHYVLHNPDGTLTEEWGDDKYIDAHAVTEAEIHVIDTWNFTGEYENVFFTSPFRDVLLPRHKAGKKKKAIEQVTHLFRVKAPLLAAEEVVCLLGSATALQDWKEDDPLLLTPDGDWWTVALSLPPESFPLEYKYGVYHKKEKRFTHWESGPNRYVPGDARPNKLSILHDGFVHLPNTTFHGAGVAIPVFSLRSKESMGVGEFTDLEGLVDWAVKCGLRLIQLLPVQDTTANHNWADSYPYAAISAFALHPIYLNLEKCAGRKNEELIKPLNKKKKELNALPELDYEQVMKLKLLVVKELYELQKEGFKEDPGFLEFFERNRDWLVPYAAFCYLRDKHGTPDFTRWTLHSEYDKEAIREYTTPEKKHYDSIALQYFIQYHLHIQLKDALDYAHEHGIVVKGDIPIGIYRYSCDAWVAPRLYHMDMQAGAPPDNFAVKGQNWGFPTYNWEEMEKDGYGWWRQRFSHMQNYFDGFRIDHILGFFRIWSIPMNVVEGILGHFVPAIPVHRVEFQQRNIWFDRDRYTRPFINDAVLWDIFGEDAGFVKEHYLQPADNALFELRESYNTQRKIASAFRKEAANTFNEKMRIGLYDLVSNVILLEVEGSEGLQFHFRISMEQTSSFRFLEWHTQQQLKDLYVNYFYNRQDDFWRREAMHKLPELKRATNMLVFGEDLGMVPRSVPEVMRQLGILSLEVQRMPKDSTREFSYPAEAPYLSVVTPSTHDMSTIRGWWEEDRAQTQRFFNRDLGQWGEAPRFCEPWINKAIVLQHLHSPAQWAIFQLQDLMGMSEQFRRENPNDERINVPANPHHYWRYRMHLTLEELLHEKAFNSELRREVEASGR